MELQPGQTVRLEIFNQSYSIRPNDGDIERTRRLAASVDRQMREIARGGLAVDSLRIAILAALHMADELDRAKSRYEELNDKLATRSAECADALDQVLKYRGNPL